MSKAYFLDCLNPKIVNIVRGHSYWVRWEIKRKYGKYPSVCIDKFVLPKGLFDLMPKHPWKPRGWIGDIK